MNSLKQSKKQLEKLERIKKEQLKQDEKFMKMAISQAKLAEDVGISLSYISKIEASGCDKSVSVSVLNQIANALGIEITKLFEKV